MARDNQWDGIFRHNHPHRPRGGRLARARGQLAIGDRLTPFHPAQFRVDTAGEITGAAHINRIIKIHPFTREVAFNPFRQITGP